jgi:hypothetical protein
VSLRNHRGLAGAANADFIRRVRVLRPCFADYRPFISLLQRLHDSDTP